MLLPQISSIKHWPKDDRPREKLFQKGVASLSNAELLALLLCSGAKGLSALDLARDILNKFSSFRQMAHRDARDWNGFKGLGEAKMARIQAALEIGRRFREDDISVHRHKICSAKDVADMLIPHMRDLKTEVFKVVHLDSNNHMIELEHALTGTVNHAMPIVREIMHSALQKFSVSIICAHNHPSGIITPSSQDRQFTQQLSAAGALMNVKLLDHVIIGGDSYYSFSDDGIV